MDLWFYQPTEVQEAIAGAGAATTEEFFVVEVGT